MVIAYVVRRVLPALLTLSIAQLQPNVARADPATAKAKLHNDEAEKHFNLGHFREAAAEYEKAYRAKPVPEFLHNLGQCYRRIPGVENLQKAVFYFESYLENAPDSPNRKDVEAEISEVKREIDAKRSASAAAATAPSPALAPPAASSTPFYKKWWFWTVVGVVVVGATTTAAVLGTRTETTDGVLGTMPPGQIRF